MTEIVETEDKIFDLENRLEETRLKLRDLATMGAIIASILDIETILSVVMEMSIRTVEGEVGLIQLSEKGELISKITWGVDDTSIRNILYQNDEDISNYCFHNEEAIAWNDLDKTFKFGPTITGILALPIKSRARCHGTIVIINKTSGAEFTDEDKSNDNADDFFAAANCIDPPRYTGHAK